MTVQTLLCVCEGYRRLPAEAIEAFQRAAEQRGETIKIVSDLCFCAMRTPELIREFAPDQVAACHPRAVKALLTQAGVEVGSIIDLRGEKQEQTVLTPSEGWVPWFPVIDRDRCIRCGKCADFCLFGVYAVNPDRTVQVIHPESCKTNCPACARVCPVQAVIFPKHPDAPVNGGEAVPEAPPESLPAHDLMSQLQNRRKNSAPLFKESDK